MAKINRSWNRMNREDRLDLGKSIVEKVTAGDTVVPVTHADFVAFSARQTSTQAKLDAVKALDDQLRMARLELAAEMDEWLPAINQLATTSEGLSHGRAADIAAIGFAPSSEEPPARPQPLTQVQGLVVTAGDSDGELDYTHERTAGARGYERQTTTTPNDAASWVDRDSITRSSGTLAGLPSGTRQWVRVRATGPLDPGPWSDPATKIVP